MTFSRDHSLRLWPVEPVTQYQCGVDPSEENSGATLSSDEEIPEEGKEAAAAAPSASLIDLPSTSSGASCCHSDSIAAAEVDRDSTPSKTLTNNTLQQEFEVLSLNLGSVKAEGLSSSGKRSVKFTATVAANQVWTASFFGCLKTII